MAAADVLVDAVKTRKVRERVRARAAGAFARERPDGSQREALNARRREEGKLTEWERSELLYFWSGNSAAQVRSVQGAVEDRLLRAPPKIGAELEAAVEVFLNEQGKGGAPREKLVELLAAENVGATRYEARLTLRRMVGAGRVEFFKAEVLRKKPCTCKSPMGEVEGQSQGAPGSKRRQGPCTCGSGALEPVVVEMVRLSPDKPLRSVPKALTPAERWAKADAELEAFCHTISASESSHSGGSRLPPPVRGGSEKARAAMSKIPLPMARVIERAYGTLAATWSGLSPEAARLAPLCPAVEKARREYVDDRTTALGHWGNPDARAAIDRSTYAVDVLRKKLDAAPDDEVGRARWNRERDAFVKAVESEAAKMLEGAVRAYREARL